MAGIIQTYGLFWNESDVYWNTTSKNAQLLGFPHRSKNSGPRNFKDQVGIYVLYSGHDIIYVGQTGSGNNRLFSRLKKHRNDHLAGRWDKFSWFGLLRLLDSGRLSGANLRTTSSLQVSLNHIEAVLLAATEPVLNKQGGRFGRQAKKIHQYRDEKLGKTESDLIRDIWQSLQSDS
jgi:hypothetical protein